MIVYQELMKYYGISPSSMFDKDGILKTMGGEEISTLIKDLNEKQRPPALYQPRQQRFEQWVDYQKKLVGEKGVKKLDLSVEAWQKERYERYELSQENEKKNPYLLKNGKN